MPFPMSRRRVFSGGVLAAFALCAVLDAPAARAEDLSRATLTVVGQGEARAAPDMASLSTGVVTVSKTAEEALAGNSKSVADVIAAIKDAGVEAKDLVTSGFSIQPQYTYPQQGQREAPRLTGYEVRNTVNVKVRDLSTLGGLLDKLVQAGANQASGLSFTLQDPSAIERQARLAAIQDAKAQAQSLAEATGLRLVRIRSISPQPDFGLVAPAPMMMKAEARAAVPVQAGETTAHAQITIVYDAEPR
ncbi:SIMPL domain-containing protein [Roseixanthobacter glucoisosaccharinicivorans]|uniref:SIMPL domain-containing protein n=1 Tax=Roseixanthobacter glucoisosaccharinicivorans TaxID=3119923 RepID=UPI00372794CD